MSPSANLKSSKRVIMSATAPARATRRSAPSRAVEDSAEVTKRIEAGLRLVPPIVAQMKQSLRTRKDDLGSFGNEGALIAGRTYDPERGVPFTRWATLKIRCAILDGLRGEADLPRRLYARIRALGPVSFTQEGLAPRDLHVAPGGATAADARLDTRLAAMATAYAAGSLFATGDTVLGSLADPRGNPEEQLSREQLKAAIRSAIAARPDEERALLERYYFGGMTLRDAARGLSESWASRLHARAIGGVAKSLQRTHEEVLLARASRAPRA